MHVIYHFGRPEDRAAAARRLFVSVLSAVEASTIAEMLDIDRDDVVRMQVGQIAPTVYQLIDLSRFAMSMVDAMREEIADAEIILCQVPAMMGMIEMEK